MVREMGSPGLALLFVVLLTSSALAQHVVQIDDAVAEYNLMPNELTYYVDAYDTLGFDDIRSTAFAGGFQVHRDYQNKDFKVDAAYWIRIPIQTRVPTRKIWLLEFYDQTIDEIDAYLPNVSGGYDHVRFGDTQPFADRTFRHKNFEMVLDTKSDEVRHYYFRIRSHQFADMRVAIRSADRFIFYALNEYFLFGTFYGMILIISVYNLLVFLAIREIKNLYYIFYILSVAAYAMSYDGIGFQYLWPAHPKWNDYAVGITLYSVIVWALVFTRRFLNTRANAPELDRALLGMIIARSIFFALELLAFSHLLSYRNIEIIPLSLIFFTGIYVLRRGYRPARFFVIAYGILFTGFFIRTLVYFNILPFTTPLHYSLHIAFVLEMVFLTFALGDRIRILKDMRDRALRRIIQQHEVNMQLKDKVNRELEQKVQERTLALNDKNHQLEEINSKLERQSREINQINSMLDLDNWKLKNSLKEVLNDRIMEKAMDYKQFRTLYPDTLACYRFLDQLKWEKGYACRKCHNSKYFDGAQKFARRCTKCGYNESITSYTIFHSIKFPIDKAFYVAFLGVSGNKDRTLESLAQLLDMRVNTLWTFKQKIAERITVLQAVGHVPHASRWEEIILLNDEPEKPKRPRHTAATLGPTSQT